MKSLPEGPEAWLESESRENSSEVKYKGECDNRQGNKGNMEGAKGETGEGER